jgi:hypothetical protein
VVIKNGKALVGFTTAVQQTAEQGSKDPWGDEQQIRCNTKLVSDVSSHHHQQRCWALLRYMPTVHGCICRYS